jgi:hypothetical protein
MQHSIDIIRQSRAVFIHLCRNLTMEQMNLIPAGFNNNIIWNFGHSVVTQQSLCYSLSGLPLKIEKSLLDKYRRGSKPEGFITEDEYQMLQALSVSLINELEKDLEAGIFKQYSPFMTSLNVEVDSIEKAIAFNAYHEGLHLGTMLALKKMVK